MRVPFSVICNYFAPIFHISGRFGLGSTVLMFSHLETAISLMKIDLRLCQMNYEQHPEETGGLGGMAKKMTLPSDEDISSFYDIVKTDTKTALLFDKNDLKNAMDFHIKTEKSAKLPQPTIADMAYDYKDLDGNLTDISYLKSGKKSDTFGIIKVMEKMFYDSASQLINSGYDLSDTEVLTVSDTILEDRIALLRNKKPEISSDENVEKLINNLKKLSIMELKNLGINTETFAFKYRNNVGGSMDSKIFSGILKLAADSNNSVTKFVEFMNQLAKNEEKLAELLEEKEGNFNEPIPVTDMAEFDSWIQAVPMKETEIKEHLSEIKNHYASADKMFMRSGRYVPGMEKASYPKTLALDLMKKGNKIFLTELVKSHDHKQGMLSIMKQDSENIFKFAYENDRIAKNWDWIKLLSHLGFKFEDIHLKTLFKHILADNDTEFFDYLVKNESLDLFDYQSNRGITYYHSILLEGSERMIKHAHDNYIIRHPNIKTDIVPYDELTCQPSTSYRSAKEDRVCAGPFKNCSKSGMTLRKGMDSLTITAAKGDFVAFCCVLRASADCTQFLKINPECFDIHCDYKSAINCIQPGRR